MPDEPGRLPGDIEFARWVAQTLGEPLQRIRALPIHAMERTPGRGLFDQLVGQVQEVHAAGRVFLTPERDETLRQEFDRVVQILAFYDAIDHPGVLMLRGYKNVYDLPILVDVFSPGAQQSLLSPPEPGPSLDRPQDWRGLRFWVDRVAKQARDVVLADRSTATGSFLTLFADSLRAMARVFRGGGTSTFVFTVHSANSGYQLDYHPQWRYAPTVFGSKLSTPVSRSIPTGHYCFYGRKSGLLITDPGIHFAGPSNTSTTTTAF